NKRCGDEIGGCWLPCKNTHGGSAPFVFSHTLQCSTLSHSGQKKRSLEWVLIFRKLAFRLSPRGDRQIRTASQREVCLGRWPPHARRTVRKVQPKEPVPAHPHRWQRESSNDPHRNPRLFLQTSTGRDQTRAQSPSSPAAMKR